MSYLNRFISTDNLIAHLTPYLTTITDAAIKANYAGFLSVSAVTVYELAIKDIFIDFADKKNTVFGEFVAKHFLGINGRIKLKDLKEHVKPFGNKYFLKFEAKLKIHEKVILRTKRKDLRTTYTNLILCRHQFVHVGAPTLSLEEVLTDYEIGKEVITSLYEAMKR